MAVSRITENLLGAQVMLLIGHLYQTTAAMLLSLSDSRTSMLHIYSISMLQ